VACSNDPYSNWTQSLPTKTGESAEAETIDHRASAIMIYDTAKPGNSGIFLKSILEHYSIYSSDSSSI